MPRLALRVQVFAAQGADGNRVVQDVILGPHEKQVTMRYLWPGALCSRQLLHVSCTELRPCFSHSHRCGQLRACHA